MNIDLGGLPVIIVSFVIIAGLILFFKFIIIPLGMQQLIAQQIIEMENGFTFNAGGWFDNVHLTFPFVTVILNEKNLSIQYSGIEINLVYEKINTVNIYSGRISNGIEIKHDVPEISSIIIIWTPYYKQVVEYIQSKQRRLN
jgi:hypothetical protein